MKYALVFIWFVNGQVTGQVVREFSDNSNYSARDQCHREQYIPFACVPIPPSTPETKP